MLHRNILLPVFALLWSSWAAAQPPQQPPAPQVQSPEILEGNKVAFRILAPKAANQGISNTASTG